MRLTICFLFLLSGLTGIGLAQCCFDFSHLLDHFADRPGPLLIGRRPLLLAGRSVPQAARRGPYLFRPSLSAPRFRADAADGRGLRPAGPPPCWGSIVGGRLILGLAEFSEQVVQCLILGPILGRGRRLARRSAGIVGDAAFPTFRSDRLAVASRPYLPRSGL